MPELLATRGLRVARGRRVLLDGLELSVTGGEILRVTGANGSGKSSLLRVLAGVVAPRAGQVERRARCAYVPERVLLAPGLRGARWATLMAQARATPSASVARELDRRARVLSKGQLQRLALADALAGHAGLLILDEPCTGLDARAGRDLTARLAAAAASGAAVVFTDHAAAGALAPTRTLPLGAAVPAALVRLVLVDPEGGRHERVVPASERDALLAEHLARGWGVESVRPA